MALAARTAGVEALILPRENLAEAGVVSGLRVLGAGSLAEIEFMVSNDRTLECQYSPVQFYWLECTDNARDCSSVYTKSSVRDWILPSKMMPTN